MLKKIKVGVYIDGSNIYHGGLRAGWQLEYSRLKLFIERKFEISVIKYYNSIGYEKDQHGKYLKDKAGQYILNKASLSFEKYLRKIGIQVISKPLKFIKGRESIASNKLDGDLMIDALLEHKSWDELILLSGDSDFERLIKEMIKVKKKVQVLSFNSRISYEIRHLAVTSELVTYLSLDKLRTTLGRVKK